MKDKRYIITIELYIYQEDDIKAIKEAESIAAQLRSKDDNRANVVGLVEQKIATIGNRKIDLT